MFFTKSRLPEKMGKVMRPDEPFILGKDSVRGFVYEVETGTLREVA